MDARKGKVSAVIGRTFVVGYCWGDTRWRSLNKGSGKAIYAIMSFGGFLGIDAMPLECEPSALGRSGQIRD